MVFFSSHQASHRLPVKLLRILIGLVAIALIVLTLYHVPYDILREERFRLYGEAATNGMVISIRTVAVKAHDERFAIDYKYIDQDGFRREASAAVPYTVWRGVCPGDRIEVFYALSRPGLSRVRGEIEPAFQVWLRDALN